MLTLVTSFAWGSLCNLRKHRPFPRTHRLETASRCLAPWWGAQSSRGHRTGCHEVSQGGSSGHHEPDRGASATSDVGTPPNPPLSSQGSGSAPAGASVFRRPELDARLEMVCWGPWRGWRCHGLQPSPVGGRADVPAAVDRTARAPSASARSTANCLFLGSGKVAAKRQMGLHSTHLLPSVTVF